MIQAASYMNVPKSENTETDFHIQQFFLGCLAQFSYCIESDGEALVIDPMREPQTYLEYLESRNAKLKYILETHIHADFVSSHLDLAKETGATIVYGPNAHTSFDFKCAQDGEILKIGKIQLKVIHTPGHTMESSCFLLLDKNGNEYCVFTGDTLFLGDVGRPDLAVKEGSVTKEDLAGYLYDSIRNKIMTLPDSTIVYPGHGAGSGCGKAIGQGFSCTVGIQKSNNYALQPMTRDEFILQVASNIPKPPQYYFHDVAMNKEGPKSLEQVMDENLKSLNWEEFCNEIQNGALILDCRESLNEGVIDGALNVSISVQFATWVGTLVKPEQNLVLITDPGKEDEAVLRLARIGYNNVKGQLNGGFKTYVDNGGKYGQVQFVSFQEFVDTKGEPDKHVFVDVRKPGEWSDGVYPGALCITLSELQEKSDLVPKDKTIHVYCKAGGRAKMGMTILRNAGFTEFVMINGGIDQIVQANNIQLQKVNA